MNLSDWKVTRIDADGDNWRIALNNPAATSQTGNANFFYNTFGQGAGFVKINDGVRNFNKISAIGSGIKDYYVFASKRPGDLYYYPPFLSWADWALTTSGWITNGLSDSIYSETGTSNSQLNDYAYIPMSWAVSGDPIDWSEPEGSGVVAASGVRTDGTPLNLIHNNSYIESFFNSGQYIYISGLEAKLVATPDPQLNGSTGLVNLYLKESYIDPTGGNSIYASSLPSTIYNTDSSLTAIAKEIGFPLDTIQINYEFSETGGYADGAIISEAPCPLDYISTSGEVVGSSSLTGTSFNKASFARNGYIEVKNANDLNGDDFCLLFDCSKQDSKPATIFSNIGLYSETDVSGFEIGINSANYLYFKNYEDFLPSIHTYSNAGATRNLYYVSAVGNKLELGRFDFENSYFVTDTFSIDRNFIRDSYDWKIGTGEYGFSGEINSFMYINPFQQGGTAIQEFGDSFQQSVFKEPPVIDILPGSITGYDTYTTSGTGVIWYTGRLSGCTTGVHTGTQITGTGLTSTLNLKGRTDLYPSGDLNSGLYIFNSLLYFGINSSGTGFYEVSSPSTQELSSITWHNERKTLFGIDDNDSVVTEFNRNRKKVREIPGNLNDAEGICYMSGNTLGFLDERDPYNNGSGAIYYGTVDSTTALINTGSLNKIEVAIDGSSNIGLEGITFDTGRNCFYAVKEKTPASLYRVNLDGSLIHYAAFDNLMSDYSDVFYEKNTDSIYLLSDEDRKIMQTSLGGDIWYEKDISYIEKPEGIAISEDLEKMYICSDLTGQPGAFLTADQNSVPQYVFSEKLTGFASGLESAGFAECCGITSGYFNQNNFIYLKEYNTGLGFTAVTGFVTGEEEFTYTGCTPVYTVSGITGYDGTVDYSYSGLSGNGISFLVSGIRNKFLNNSSKFSGYLYDRLSIIGSCGTGDIAEIKYPRLWPNLEYINSGYGFSGEAVMSEAPRYGKLNVFSNYGFDDKIGRPGFYTSSQHLTGAENIYLNGVIQRPGTIKYTTDKSYNQVPYVSGGDYAFSGTQVFDSGTGFLLFNYITDDILYSDLQQPQSTSGVRSQRVDIENVSQYADYITLGISGIHNEIFLNGQKLYSGVGYIVKDGHYFFATGGTQGVTGNIYTIPKNELLNSETGDGAFYAEGLFLDNNIGFCNGFRLPAWQTKVFSSKASLLSGNQVITNSQEFHLSYHRNYDNPTPELQLIEIDNLPDWSWSGALTGDGTTFSEVD
jgi:uncharacterized protein YjiK